jgi:predicted  nucleic acid-binding Zn-ribbon protein
MKIVQPTLPHLINKIKHMNSRQIKKQNNIQIEANNTLNISTLEYINSGFNSLMEFMSDFKQETRDWRADTEEWRKHRDIAHSLLVAEIAGIQKTIFELSGLQREIVIVKEDLEETRNQLRKTNEQLEMMQKQVSELNGRIEKIGTVKITQLAGWAAAAISISYTLYKDWFKK